MLQASQDSIIDMNELQEFHKILNDYNKIEIVEEVLPKNSIQQSKDFLEIQKKQEELILLLKLKSPA